MDREKYLTHPSFKGIEPFKNKIWLSSPTMHGEEQKWVDEAIRTNWVSTVGANINEVERMTAEKVGCKYAVALSSGTASLHLAVKLAGERLYGQPKIGHGTLEGKRVFCSDMTFDATVNPVAYEGGEAVFIDTEYDTWNMDPIALEKAFEIYPDVKLIVVAHLYGTPGKIDEIRAVADKHGALIIEDAAESFGATYKGRQTGNFGDYGAISHNGNKIITTGGGGAVTAKDAKTVAHMQYISTQAKDDPHYYIHNEVGYNYRMTNLQAALGVAQMEELPEFIKRKHSNYELYQKLLDGFELGKLLGFREGTYSNQWFYSLEIPMERVNGSLRNIITKLQERGVQTRAIWGLIHEQLPYQNAITYEMEKAPYYSKCILNFPSSTQITEDDIVYVVEQIKDVLMS